MSTAKDIGETVIQDARRILMVRPATFGFSIENAESNVFQRRSEKSDAELQRTALAEFDRATETIRSAGVDLVVYDQEPNLHLPDAVFPNNWVSFHENTYVLYPMLSKQRRMERQMVMIPFLNSGKIINYKKHIDLTPYEISGKFLEGTGSIVFDYENRIAYACLSPRTDVEVLNDLCQQLGYRPCSFNAVDETGVPVYHTNVILSICSDLVIFCEESIRNQQTKDRLKEMWQQAGRMVMGVTLEQARHFTCNVYQVTGKDGERKLLMSGSAFDAFTKDQRGLLEEKRTLVRCDIPTIEETGGGSLRCMVARIA